MALFFDVQDFPRWRVRWTLLRQYRRPTALISSIRNISWWFRSKPAKGVSLWVAMAVHVH